MKYQMNKNKKGNKGITLIVLIITVIIMLILIAVVVDIAIDGKLIDSAKEAVEGTNDKVGQVQTRVDELMEIMNELEEENTVNIITFTIDGVEYEAEEGMTWGEWCDSEYNTDGFYMDNPASGDLFLYTCDRCPVSASEEEIDTLFENDIIIENSTLVSWVTCFVAGTQVMCNVEGETKNIEEFKPGDVVISYDIFNDKYYEAEVVELIVHDGIDKARKLADIVLEDGTKLTCTPEHPLYTEEGFKAINNKKHAELQEGDKVKTVNGYQKITNINIYEVEPTTVYNLNVKDFEEIVDNDLYDTFIVNSIVVHNAK